MPLFKEGFFPTQYEIKRDGGDRIGLGALNHQDLQLLQLQCLQSLSSSPIGDGRGMPCDTSMIRKALSIF